MYEMYLHIYIVYILSRVYLIISAAVKKCIYQNWDQLSFLLSFLVLESNIKMFTKNKKEEREEKTIV